MKSLGVVGGGAMGSALINGILQAGLIQPEQIFLVEPDLSKRNTIQESLGIQSKESLADLAEECHTIILAVKPQVISLVLKELSLKVEKEHLLISIAAGIPLETLETQLPKARFVRVMPNTPAQIGRGVSVYCLGQNGTGIDSEKVAAIFGCVGAVIQLPESSFDAVTALSGSGPAYVYQFIEALIDAGVMLGLARKDALLMAVETVSGSAELVKQSAKHPAQLANEVTSPGGTTAAALFELQKNAFEGIVMKAVTAAAQRSKELGKPAK